MIHGSYVIRESSYEGPSQYVDIGLKIHVANAQGSQVGYQRKRQSIFKTSKILRLKRTHYQTVMRVEQRLIQGLILINKTAEQLQLPEQTRDRAAYLLRKTLPHYDIYRSQNTLLVCVLVLAVREHRLPFKESDFLEIISIHSRHKHQLNRTKFFLMKHLGIRWPSHRPECFIPKIISAIQKNPRVLERLERRKGTQDYFNRLERLTTKLLQSMTSIDYGGRFPDILAASAVYTIDSQLLRVITQRDAGETVGVVDFSIRDHYNGLWKHRQAQIEELLEVVE
jgi:transcription initiation factor TFIIIB Brf1 subunit/transcription initiation factor TFIIB